jgi:large repetitive protein
VTGLAAPSLDKVNGANNASASPSVSTTVATAEADEIAFGVFVENLTSDSFTQGAGWTKLQSQQCGTTNVFLLAEYKILAATGVQTANGSFAASQSWAAAIATYEAAAIIPANTVAPSISGTAQVGDTLTGSDGTWSESPTSYTRQWYRDNTGGGVYSAVAGATGSTYLLVDADDGCNIKFGVVATNGAGSSAEVRSSAVGPIIEQLPVNTVAPSIGGTVEVGSTLTGDDGTWTHLPTSYTRQWYRDDHGGGTFTAIAGETGTAYTLADVDDQCQIEYGVAATNDDGTTAETRSDAVGLVVEPDPVNTVAPAVSGEARVGTTLSCSAGTWDNMAGHAPSFTYQWRKSTDGGTTWTDIAGETANTYTPVNGDVGDLLDCVVSAHNSGSP